MNMSEGIGKAVGKITDDGRNANLPSLQFSPQDEDSDLKKILRSQILGYCPVGAGLGRGVGEQAWVWGMVGCSRRSYANRSSATARWVGGTRQGGWERVTSIGMGYDGRLWV